MIFDFESSKTAVEQKKTIFKNRFIDKLPGVLSSNAYWKSFPYMDTIQFMHKYDRNTALKYFPKLLPESKTIIIPHAYDPTDMNISNHLNIKDLNYPSKYLISCANISERKQSILLAKYAKKQKYLSYSWVVLRSMTHTTNDFKQKSIISMYFTQVT